MPRFGTVVATIGDKNKTEVIPLMRRFERLGYRLMATKGTAKVLRESRLIDQAGQ